MKDNQESYTVYMHITPSNKKYIGITKQNPKDRWKNGKGYMHNKYFWNAIQKYGWNNIQHTILFNQLSKEEAKQIEIELIKKYNLTDRNNGYNITKGGDGLNGMIVSEETKIKMSKNHHHLCSDQYGAKNPFAKAVINLNENIVYTTIREANKSIGKNYYNSDISSVCRGRKKHTGKDKNGNKIKWQYLNDYLADNNLSLEKSKDILTFI